MDKRYEKFHIPYLLGAAIRKMNQVYLIPVIAIIFFNSCDNNSTESVIDNVAGSLLYDSEKVMIDGFCDCDRNYYEEIITIGNSKDAYQKNQNCIVQLISEHQINSLPTYSSNYYLGCIKVARTQICPEVYRNIEPYIKQWENTDTAYYED